MESLWFLIIVAMAFIYYGYEIRLGHKEKLKELELQQKQVELEILKEKNSI